MVLTPQQIDEKRKELGDISKQLSDLANTPQAKDISFADAHALKEKADVITKDLESAFNTILGR
jgi:hypothetical protein